MQIEIAAKRLAELGHPTRLQIFRHLVKEGNQGAPVGDLQSALDIPGSTLSHHITRLISVGLVKQRREGRTLFCIAQYEKLDELMNYLQDECCINEKNLQEAECS